MDLHWGQASGAHSSRPHCNELFKYISVSIPSSPWAARASVYSRKIVSGLRRRGFHPSKGCYRPRVSWNSTNGITLGSQGEFMLVLVFGQVMPDVATSVTGIEMPARGVGLGGVLQRPMRRIITRDRRIYRIGSSFRSRVRRHRGPDKQLTLQKRMVNISAGMIYKNIRFTH